MGGNIHTNVGNANARNQYLAAGQLQDGTLTYGTTGGSTNAYTLSLTPSLTAYVEGQMFTFKASFANTGAATLNVNSVGDKAITVNGTVALRSGTIPNGAVVTVVYDGTQFQATSIDTLPTPISSKYGALVVQNDADNGFDLLSNQGNNGQVLTSLGANTIPTWQDTTDGTVTSVTVNAGTGLTGGGTITTSGSVTLNLDSNTQQKLVKAWVSFDASGSLSVKDSFNVSSVTDNGTGNYTINFSSSLGNNKYAAVGLARDNNNVAASAIVSPFSSDTKSSSSYEIHTSVANSLIDPSEVNLIVFGD